MLGLSLWLRRGIMSPAIIAAVVISVLIPGCSDSPCVSPCMEPESYEAHEWGVMVGCEADPSFFLTSRPETVVAVRIPVIYFHSAEEMTFTARVEFKNGRPTDTYPEATIASSCATWENVTLSKSAQVSRTRATGGFVPLEAIIKTLNAVDADMLEHHGTEARFLFYEGEMEFDNRIAASYDFEARQATLESQSDYPVHNVMLVAAETAPFGPTYFATLDRLDPGSTITVDFAVGPSPDLRIDLLALGFTEKEAASFAVLWKGPFFLPSPKGASANLIYRLPQTEYDELISLEIDPEPEKVIRALYILVHLDG